MNKKENFFIVVLLFVSTLSEIMTAGTAEGRADNNDERTSGQRRSERTQGKGTNVAKANTIANTVSKTVRNTVRNTSIKSFLHFS